MNVNQIMSKNIICVKMDDKLSRVKELFEETSFHHLLVVGDHKLLGVISDRDLLKILSPQVDTLAAKTKDLILLKRRAHQIMTRKPIVINENANVRDAVDIFNEHTISCIPVLNDDEKPVGILSWRDIMRELGNAR